MHLKFIFFSAQNWDVNRIQPEIYFANGNEYPFSIPRIEGNSITGDIGGHDGAALHLRWKIPSFGEVTLPTGLLKPSDKPYNLNVEIARHRLVLVSQKCREWSDKGFKPSKEFRDQLEKSSSIFQYMKDSETQAVNARWADLSLSVSMPAGEMLAMEYADWGIAKRKRSGGFAGFLFGCNFFNYPDFGKEYEKEFKKTFNYATLPFYWNGFEPRQGEFAWKNVNPKIEWLEANKLPMKGHPLLWFHSIPTWVSVADVNAFKDLVRRRIQHVVGTYKGRIAYWDVINEIQHVNPFSRADGIELTRLCSETTKAADPSAKRIVNCDEPFGEYMAKKPASLYHPVDYFSQLAKSNVDYDIIGIQVYQGTGWNHCRDLFEMSRYFDKYEQFGKPVHITEVGVPSAEGEDPDDYSSGDIEKVFPGLGTWKTSMAGFWHHPWDQETQADWAEGFYKLLMGKPFVTGITWWDFTDHGKHFLTHSGLLDKDLKPKLSCKRIRALRQECMS
jgi:endo-1,4-beta-xylanase